MNINKNDTHNDYFWKSENNDELRGLI
jgi:hypothetical protein